MLFLLKFVIILNDNKKNLITQILPEI